MRTIIKADAQHAPVIYHLENQLFTDSMSLDSILSSLDHDRIFVCVEKEQVIGYIWTTIAVNEMEILRIGVHPDFRRQGIANHLLQAVFRDIDIDYCFLEVRKSNYAAQMLYESCGFVIVGERKSFYRNPTEDAILMKKSMELQA